MKPLWKAGDVLICRLCYERIAIGVKDTYEGEIVTESLFSELHSELGLYKPFECPGCGKYLGDSLISQNND